jgi:hypothetical protein
VVGSVPLDCIPHVWKTQTGLEKEKGGGGGGGGGGGKDKEWKNEEGLLLELNWSGNCKIL